MDKISEEIAYKFLSRNFPIMRVKYGVYFKKAIIIDDDTKLFIDNKNSIITAKSKIKSTLTTAFEIDSISSENISNNYLKNFLSKK